jgi:two-component system cell cycle response regulator
MIMWVIMNRWAEDFPEIMKEITILCVEDESDARDKLSGFLSKNFGQVFTASDGIEGLDVFDEHKPDIIITDIQMPLMNGLEMAEEIRKKCSGVPIIITTGYDDEKYLVGSIDIGAIKYIKKPVDIKKLRNLLSDVSLNIVQQKEKAKKDQLLRLVMDNSAELYLMLDDNNIHYMNRPFMRYIGFDNSKGNFAPTSILHSVNVLKDSDGYCGVDFREWLKKAQEKGITEAVIKVQGASILKSESVNYLIRLNRVEEEKLLMISMVDISNIENANILTDEPAMIDPLTGIMNKKKFFGELDKELYRVQRYSRPLSIIIFDIDGFSEINERYGRQVGDSIIKEIAQLVKQNTRVVDTVARYGGEEFIILAPETDVNGAFNLAEKIRQKVEMHNFSHVERVTCSFGVTEYVLLQSSEMIIKTADDALYMAKSKGRNRVESLSFF